MYSSDKREERSGGIVQAGHVNPFIISVCKVLKDMCMLDLQIGKPALQSGSYPSGNSIIELGLKGNLSGDVVLNIEHSTALEIVSKMMMTPVDQIDAIGQSAISELGNMVAGNAATVFANSNILIDITTPTYYNGNEYPERKEEFFSVPFSSEAGNLSVDIHIDE